MSGLDRVVATMWDAPAALAARRGHPALARILSDGGWLRVWPPLAIAAPLIGVATGWYAATSRTIYENVFTASMTLMVLFAVVAAAGAVVGLLAMVAYAVGDTLMYDHTFDAAILHPDGIGHITLVVIPLVGTYLLLGLLTVNVPLVASTVRRSVQRRAGLAAGVGAGVAAAFAGAWSWVALAPHVLRATYSYQSIWDFPVHGTTLIFTPILNDGWTVVWTATAAMAARLVVQALVERSRPAIEPPAAPRARPNPARVATAVVVGAVFAFALVGGVAQTKGQFLLLVAACTGAALLRSALLPASRPYVRFTLRVPMFARAAIAVGVTYALARLLASDATMPTTNPLNSNASFVLTIAISAPIIALLFPASTNVGVSE